MDTTRALGPRVIVFALLVISPLYANAQNSPFKTYIPAPPAIPPEIEASGGVSKTQVDPAYATLYGGAGYDELLDHAVSGGVACMVGPTSSNDLVLFAPFQDMNAGGFDGWIACGDIETGVPYFASYFGSDQNETITGADISNDTLYVVGVTLSQTMPGTDETSYQQAGGGGEQDCFVSRMSVFDGSGLKTTFFGMEGDEFCSDIVVGGGGVWIAGTTDMAIDLVDPLQSELKGPSDAFVAMFPVDLSTLGFSTLLGGDAGDGATALEIAPVFGEPAATKFDDLATSPAKRVMVAGWSDGAGFPTSQDAHQLNFAGGNDSFLAVLLWDYVARTILLQYATYLGGTGNEVAQALAFTRGLIAITGWTTSIGWNNVGRDRNSGSSDGFLYQTKPFKDGHTPTIAYVGPSSSYNLPLAVVVAALGVTIIAGYAIVPSFGSAFLHAIDRNHRVIANEFSGSPSAAADCNAVMAVLFWWVCGGKTSALIPTTQFAIQSVFRGQYDAFGAKYPSPWGYSFLFNMTGEAVTGKLHNYDIDPVAPRTLSAAHLIPWDLSFVYLLAAAVQTYQINRLMTALTAQIIFSYIFPNQVLTVEVPIVSRGEIGILAYNDLGRPIVVIRQDKTSEHGEIMRTTVEADQFFFIPLPKDQNVVITDGVDVIVYTPSRRSFRSAFPYFAGVLQDRVEKTEGSQEFELLLFDGTGDPVELPITTATEASDDLPSGIVLHANHPNPFSEATTLGYEIPGLSSVRLEVFDIMGRRVRTLVDGLVTAGDASATWNGDDDAGRSLSSGTYLARLQVGGHVVTKTMVLAR